MNLKTRAISQHAQITSSNRELKNAITHKELQCLMMDRLIPVARPTLRTRGYSGGFFGFEIFDSGIVEQEDLASMFLGGLI